MSVGRVYRLYTQVSIPGRMYDEVGDGGVPEFNWVFPRRAGQLLQGRWAADFQFLCGTEMCQWDQ